MPPPPPPPPRLPPPTLLPPPPPPAANQTPRLNSNSTSVPDRSALLSQIRGGAKLKKAATNDRSSPLLQKSQSSASGNGARSQNTAAGGPSALSDLFSQGMPKLRPAGSRAGEGNTTQRPSFANKVSSVFPPSEAQTNRPNRIPTKSADGKNGLNKSIPFNESNSSQAATKPTPPPSILKPSFLPDSNPGMNFSKSPLQSKTPTRNSSNLPIASSKQVISTIQNTAREDSHIPSGSKPLPPPKQIQSTIKFDGQLQVKPLPPSKLPTNFWNANRPTDPSHNVVKANGLIKPSQPVTHSHTFSASSLTHDRQHSRPEHKGMSTLNVNSTMIRNHSAPDNLNQLIRHNSPRLPPPIPPTNRVIHSPLPRHPPKFQDDRPSLPPQPMLIRSAEPPPLPKSAPPPLPHRSPQTLPRFVGKTQGIPPPLPMRAASKLSNQLVGTQDFESRFRQMFHETQEFPCPHYQLTPHKFYMSQAYTQEMKGAPIERQMGNQLLIRKAAEC